MSGARTGRGRVAYGLALAGIGAAEVAYLAWALLVPLYNATAQVKGDGPPVRRVLLLLNLVPGVIPDVTWRDSGLGSMVEKLGHVENLPQRLPIVLAGGFLLASGVALGMLALRALGLHRRWSVAGRLAVGFGLGVTGLGLFALLMGRAGFLSPRVARVGLVMPIVAEAAFLIRDRKGGVAYTGSKTNPWHPEMFSIAGLIPVVGPFLVLMALASMLPTTDFDAIEYHLEGPKEYFLAGKIRFLPHNVYTSMPFGVEMLHLLGMHVLDDWWRGALVGQLLVASFAPMAGLAVWLTARRWGSPRAAWVAAAVYLTTPWVYRLAAIPYVEGPLCYYHAALAWAAGVAWDASAERRGRAWLVVGLLAGGAMAIKYPALISAVVPFGVMALAATWRGRAEGDATRSLVLRALATPAVTFSLGVLLVVAPWLVKNVVDTGNPVYPLGYRIFGGRDWDEARERQWTNAHGPRPISAKALKDSILDVAGRSDWMSPALMALAPLAFLRRGSRRVACVLGGYVFFLFATWWLLTHRLDRFWLPLLPALAVLAGLGADWTRARAWTALLAFVLTVSIVTSAAHSTTALVALNDWTGDLRKLRAEVPRMANGPLAWLDDTLPADARPLLVGQAQTFHMNHPVVYNTVFDRDTFESIDRGRSPEGVRAELARRGITHVYVDWSEIARYRSPGNYGFTDYVTPERFDRLVRAGVLSVRTGGPGFMLYDVVPAK